MIEFIEAKDLHSVGIIVRQYVIDAFISSFNTALKYNSKEKTWSIIYPNDIKDEEFEILWQKASKAGYFLSKIERFKYELTKK